MANGNIANPDTSLSVPIVVREAETGPEGYYVVAENGHYASWSFSQTGSGTLGQTVNTCASDSLSFSNCTTSNLMKSGASGHGGNSAGAQTRVSAAFSSGLRLKTTPYPEAPAGSLVAVITC